MHIGVDATALVANRTGVGNYVYPILRGLCLNHPGSRFSLYSNDRIFFDDLPNVRHRVLTPRRRGPWWQCSHLRSMLAADRPDVYWGTNGFLPFPGIRGLATVLTVHDLAYFFAGQTLPLRSYWGRRLLQPWSARAADRLVAVSRATATDVQLHYGRAADAVVPPQIAPLFRHVAAAEKARVRQKLQLPGRFFLSLGTLEPRKNLAALADAYMAQRALTPDLAPLLLVGGAGWKNDDILEAIARGEQAGAIRRLGYVDTADLPALYGLCEAFLMPSLYEGFGMPLLEAQLCGAAVVHGPHASMREAAGGLGVICATDTGSLQQVFGDLAAGVLPLACRLAPSCVERTPDAAGSLWSQFTAAHAQHRAAA